VFGQAGPSSSRDRFFDRFRVAAAGFAKPVLSLMGDEHEWKMDRPWPEQNILRVIVEAGGSETPVEVTVTMDPLDTFQFVRDPWDGDPPPFNRGPCVDVGPDVIIDEGDVLDLSPVVTDDGVPGPGGFAVTWTKVSGSGTVVFGDRYQANTTAVFSQADLYVLRLEANDGSLSASDELAVDVLGAGAPARLSIDDVSLFEGNSGTVTAQFTVSRGGAFGEPLNVNYATANGSASAPSDYTAQSGTLSFSAFAITRTVSIAVRGDSNYELDETFFVDLSNATGGANITNSRGVGTIRNDDVQYHDLTVAVNGSGSVSLNPPGGTYADGSTVTVTGVFNPGWAFDHWSGDLSGSTNPRTIVMDSPKSVTATFVPNDPPVAGDDSYSEDEDVVLTVWAPGILANDFDPDGDSLEALPGVDPANGTLSLNDDGSFSYTPNENFHGQDVFTYLSSDGRGAVDTATVTVVVNPVNDPPTGRADEYATAERTPLTVAPPGLLENDFDVEGNPFTALPGRPPTNGLVTVNPDGSFTYEPGLAMRGLDTFTYHATDGSATSPEITVTVAVGDLEYFTFTPTDDSYIRSSDPGSDNGSKDELRVRGGNPTYTAYLKFRPEGVVDALGARLRLYVTDGGPEGGSVYETSNDYAGTSTPWEENGLHAGNAPPLNGAPLASMGSVSQGDWVEWDLGPAVLTNGTFSFGLAAVQPNSVRYSSKEDSRKPELVVHAYRGTQDVAVSPPSQDYGALRFPAGSAHTFEVRNDGSADLTVSGTSLEGPNAAEFAIERGGGSFTLVPGEMREIEVSFQPADPGAKSASLRLTTDDPDELVVDVMLTVDATDPEITVVPASHDYGDVRVQTVSLHGIEVRNDGTASLTVTATSLEGPDASEFSLVTGGGGFMVAPGESHVIDVSFVPPNLGPRSAFLRLVSDDRDENPLDVALSGRGVEPEIALSTVTYDYGDVLVSSTATHVFEVRNEGTMDLTVSAATVEGPVDFGIVAGGGSFTVGPGAIHEIEVGFQPGPAGPAAAVLRVVSNDADESSVDVSLTGTGVEPDIATSAGHDYGDVRVAATSSYVFEVRNEGTSDLTVSAPTLEGAHAAEFAIDTGGGSFTLAPGGTRQVQVRFSPVTPGLKSATLRLVSDDLDEPVVDVTLAANAIDPEITVAPASHDYGDVRVATSSSRGFEVRNDGTADLIVSETSLEGPEAVGFGIVAGGGGFTLAPGESHSIEVSCHPAVTGSMSASLRLVSDDRDESPLDVALAARGVEPEIAVSLESHDFGDVVVSSLSSQIVEVHNEGTMDLTVTSASVEGSAAFEIVTGGGSFTVRPGVLHEIEVSFQPGITGPTAATLRILSDDVDESSVDVSLSGTGVEPDIATSAGHDYGDVRVGAAPSHVFEIRNEGTSDLAVTGSSLVGTDAAEFSIVRGGGSFTVGPGDAHEVEVALNPSSPGRKSSALRLLSDDPDEGEVDVTLSGNAIEPDITITGPSHDYGDVRVGMTATHTFEIGNDGTADLVVNATSLEGPDAAEFGIEEGGESFTLSPGETHEIVVRVTPEVEGARSAILPLSSDDPDEDHLEVALSATGVVIRKLSDPPFDSDGRGDSPPGGGDDPTSPQDSLPQAAAVHGAFPNPFSSRTAIQYAVPGNTEVSLVIYNARGRLVRRLVTEVQAAGLKQVEWNGRDDLGRSVGSGIYFVKLNAAGESAIRKLVLMR
jgi:hypothetical protein